MGEMADRMQAQIEADGGLEGAAAVPGTGMEDQSRSPAGAENADNQRGGPPETIPYSRFQEVNTRYQDLKQYEALEQYGIEPDSAVRLANFEAAYVQDPKGIINTLIDSQQELSEAARQSYFEDRDHTLGSAIRSRDTGTPRSVPGSAAAQAAPPEEFKDFGAANKQILADIKAGRLPGIEQES